MLLLPNFDDNLKCIERGPSQLSPSDTKESRFYGRFELPFPLLFRFPLLFFDPPRLLLLLLFIERPGLLLLLLAPLLFFPPPVEPFSAWTIVRCS